MATWQVVNMEHNTADGGVVVVHWDVTEVDGDYSARRYGSVGLEYDASDAGFIPYADLTEATVIPWVKDSMGSDEVTAIETKLTDDIAAQKAPAQESGVPW
ncbi:MAG: hypothetical protein CMJ25_04835 [Phycisphaerae bacterium]|nr:hypothetical protein [Phycisphaerae bacterium]|tara:strand:+ start:77 stop:379 length:303 start_codon:yes stop_codon:yes gene_type:complete